MVQEHAGSGAALAVDEPHVGADQVLQRAEAPGIAARDDEALLALGEVDQGDGAAGEDSLHIGLVVDAGGWVQQVAAGQVGLAAAQGDQAAVAAGVGGGQPHRRRAAGDFAGQQVEGGVVAADGDGGVLDALGFAQEFDLDLGAGRDAFGKAGDGDQAVGPHQRHDDAGGSLKRGGNDAVADASDADADELVVAGMGDELAWGDGLDGAAWRSGAAQALLDRGGGQRVRM